MASRMLCRYTGTADRALLALSNLSFSKSSCNTNLKSLSALHRSAACMSSKNGTINHEKKLGSSTIIMQDGLYIQELPIIVRKVNDIPVVLTSNPSKLDPKSTLEGSVLNEDDSTDVLTANNDKTAGLESSKEEIAIQEGLVRCSNLSEIFKLLEIIPVEEVTPGVATCAMKCIGTFVNNTTEIRKQAKGTPLDFPLEGMTETFAWNAVIDRLCDIICTSPDIKMIIEALQTAHKANLNTKSHIMSPHNKLILECMVRVADGKVDVDQICDLVLMLHSLSGDIAYASYLDKLWIGLTNNYAKINENNIAKLFFVLPVFKRPQKMLLNMLEKRTYACWWRLKVIDVVNILSALVKIGYKPNQLVVSLTKWLCLNIHSLSESDMLNATRYIILLEHFDSNITKAVEKFTKARNTNIRNVELIATFADFCCKFRLCSPIILDPIAAYFTKHSTEFDCDEILKVVRTYGALNYTPSNEVAFFASLEDVLNAKFMQFKPEDMIELLLSCTYIRRYPLNFVTRIFNPFFLDRLKSIQNEIELQKARINLKLLDTAMNLECHNYHGPLLNKERSTRSMGLDVRIKRMREDLFNLVADILGGMNRFAMSEYNSGLPLASVYCIDFAFNLDSNGKAIPYLEKGIPCIKRKAVVINLPEHFTVGKRQLIGPQSARIRHLQAMGYEVVQLDYDKVEGLRFQPANRLDYMKSKLLH